MNRLIIVISTLFLALTACSSNNDVISNIQNDDEIDEVITESSSEQEFNKDEKTDREESFDMDEDKNVIVEDETYKEVPYLDNLIEYSEYDIHLVDDNKGKRVLIITNGNGNKTHKSIFIKHSNRLKVIEFDYGQIFNRVI